MHGGGSHSLLDNEDIVSLRREEVGNLIKLLCVCGVCVSVCVRLSSTKGRQKCEGYGRQCGFLSDILA